MSKMPDEARKRSAPQTLADEAPATKRAAGAVGGRKRKMSASLPAHSPAKNVQRTALSQNDKIKLFGEYSVLRASDKRKKGDVKQLADQYGVGSKYPSKLYDSIMNQGSDGTDGRAGRKMPRSIDEHGASEIEQVLEAANYELTYDQLADMTGYARSTIVGHCREQGYRTTLGQTAPLLSQAHKADRLMYARRHKRQRFEDYVDVDEKWAYAYRRVKKKVPKGQTAPRKKVLSKRFIPKVMILTAIARPRPEHGFDGKVGMWRVAEKAVAKNTSKNRAAGTEITVDVNMDGKTWRKMAVNLIFRAIRTKMTWASGVAVQWDNAPAHKAAASVKYIKQHCKPRHGGPDIKVEPQPAKSPDMNGNDLGFYNSIDSKIPNPRPFDCDKLFECFQAAWNTYDSKLLDQIFDSRMRVLKEVIKCKGDNTYEMPHSKKK
jgi:hypothetical protein